VIDIEHLELVSDRRLTPAAAREVGGAFAQALGQALGDRAREGLGIGRLVLEAPHAQLASARGLRQLAQSTARQLRTQLWGE
jgi:hypothetical protein